MSNYEREWGTIKIPANQFARFKRDFIDAYNAIMERRYNAAYGLWNQLRQEAKGKRGFDYHLRFEMITSNSPNKYEGILARHLFARDGQDRKPSMPKRASFPKVTYKAEQFAVDEASITFHPKTRQVAWNVPENNHACERAREDPIAMALFKLLNKVKWVRGSGGTIVGNNEYNEGPEEGDGGNYVVERYGPLGEDRVVRRR